MRRTRIAGIATGGLLAAVGIALLAAQPAAAEVNGGCKASMAGVNLAHTPPHGGPAVTVARDAVVPFSMTGVSGENFSELHIYYTIAGFDIDIYDASAGGGSWSHNVDIHSFARFGVGYYRLKGVGDFAGGRGFCDGEALIKVTGDPLGTVAGDVAAGTTVAGVLGILGAGIGAGGGGGGGGGSDPPVTQDDVAKESERQRDMDNLEHGASKATGGWCSLFGVLLLLLLPLVLLFGTGAVAMAAVVPIARVRRRRRWPFLLGAFSGLLTGLGVGVLLQQYAIVYPTRTWAIIYVAGGIALGLAVPALRRALSR